MGWATVAAAGINLLTAKHYSGKSKGIASGIVPKNIRTGNSSYNSKTGVTTLDPSIRAIQDQTLNNVSDLRGNITGAYDTYNQGLSGLRGDLGQLKSEYIGNDSAYKNAVLDPLRQQVATASGNLNKELSRTGVRGSFANQARTNLAIDSGRALADKTAQVENQRINKLGDFLGMDADILKSGLASDTGRVKMMSALENSLSGISMDRFNQEMSLLGMPARFIQGTAAQAGINANAAGVEAGATSKLLGSIVGAFDNNSSSSPTTDGFDWNDPSLYG